MELTTIVSYLIGVTIGSVLGVIVGNWINNFQWKKSRRKNRC